MVYSFFVIVFLTNIVINMDQGAMPACFKGVRKKLKIGNFEYGMIGSVVYAGLMAGAMAAGALYSKGSRIKWTIIVSLIAFSGSVMVFTIPDVYILMLFIRFVTGFC